MQFHPAAGKFDDGRRILGQRKHHVVAGGERHRAGHGADPNASVVRSP